VNGFDRCLTGTDSLKALHRRLPEYSPRIFSWPPTRYSNPKLRAQPKPSKTHWGNAINRIKFPPAPPNAGIELEQAKKWSPRGLRSHDACVSARMIDNRQILRLARPPLSQWPTGGATRPSRSADQSAFRNEKHQDVADAAGPFRSPRTGAGQGPGGRRTRGHGGTNGHDRRNQHASGQDLVY
jgi:hypothetical protein